MVIRCLLDGDDSVSVVRDFVDQWSPDCDPLEFAHDKNVAAETLCRVLLADQHIRWKHGCPRDLSYYVQYWPGDHVTDELLLRLLLDEFEYRDRAGIESSVQLFVESLPPLRTSIIEQLREQLGDEYLETPNDHVGWQERTSLPTTQIARRGGSTSCGSHSFQVGSHVSERDPNDHSTHQQRWTQKVSLPGFELIEPIGQGAFGVVYLARDCQLDRKVAIKFLRTDISRSRLPSGFALNEARRVARLDFPGIVPVYQAGQNDDGIAFMVSKFIEGGNLRDLVRRGPVHQCTAAQLVRDCARALHFAHGVGLIHRDIKTANVLIDRDQRAWITDFGLAIFEDELTESPHELTGTPAYMSPEQIQGKNSHLDGRADLWSLGVILYELVTGKRPFQGNTFAELSDQILNRSPKPIRMSQADVSPRLEQICYRSLSKPIGDRYQTARDMLDALEHFLDPTDDRAMPIQSLSHLSFRIIGTPFCYTPPTDFCFMSVGRQRKKPSGGQQGCDFVIRSQAGQEDSLRISRKHLEIIREGKQHFIIDCSKFGTRVNGRQLTKGQRQLIREGDLVSVADVLTLEVLSSKNAPSGTCPQQAHIDSNHTQQRCVIEATLGDLTTFEPELL
ncbi:MAG: protein kinase [Planctomycetales bacterium]|nr:protein kinase [Planctomycetales bacterium]